MIRELPEDFKYQYSTKPQDRNEKLIDTSAKRSAVSPQIMLHEMRCHRVTQGYRTKGTGHWRLTEQYTYTSSIMRKPSIELNMIR